MKITDETIASLQAQLAELEPERQHGRKGVVLADSEAEKKRLYNNLASRLSRAKKKLIQKNQELKITHATSIDDFGITDKDIRRYKQCYIYLDVIPDDEYIKRMTGLDDTQVAELNRRVKENELVI